MTRYTIDASALQSAASDIKGNAQRIEGEVRAMRSRLAGLQGSWTGPAAGEFQRLLQEWDSVQARVTQALTNIGTTTARAAAAYQQNEENMTALFRQ